MMMENDVRRKSAVLIAQQLLGGLSGAAIMAYVMLRSRYMPKMLHGTRKLVATLMSCFIFAHNVFIVIMDSVSLMLHTPMCEVNSFACASLQAGAIGALTAFCVSYLLMAADRLFETVAPMRYRNVNVPKAFCLVLVIITLCIALSLMFVFDHATCARATSMAVATPRETRLAYFFVALFAVEITGNVIYAFIVWQTRVKLNRSLTNATQVPWKVRVGQTSVRFLIAHLVIRAAFVSVTLGANVVLRLRLLRHPEERRSIYVLVDHFYIIQWYCLLLGGFSLIWHSAMLRQKHSIPRVVAPASVYRINTNNHLNHSNIGETENNQLENDGSKAPIATVIKTKATSNGEMFIER